MDYLDSRLFAFPLEVLAERTTIVRNIELFWDGTCGVVTAIWLAPRAVGNLANQMCQTQAITGAPFEL